MTCKCSEQASAIDAFCAANEDPYPRPYLVGDGSEFTLLAEGTTLADYTDGAALDTRGISQVALYLKVRRNVLVDPGVIGALSVLPEAGILRGTTYTWFPISVINTTLTIDGTPDDGYARRYLYQSELVFDPTGGQQSPVPDTGAWNYSVPIDVAAWDHVRFRFAGRDGTVLAAVYAARRC